MVRKNTKNTKNTFLFIFFFFVERFLIKYSFMSVKIVCTMCNQTLDVLLVYQQQNAPIILFMLFPTKWVAYRMKGQHPRIIILIRSYRMKSLNFNGFFLQTVRKVSMDEKSIYISCECVFFKPIN